MNGGPLKPGFFVIDFQWVAELVPLACPSLRIMCKVSYRKEDITKGNVLGDMMKSKVKLLHVPNGAQILHLCTVSSGTIHIRMFSLN